MQHQIICAWLGTPADRWPPDHYALLGLDPGETRVELIEQHVHERLAKVRCYQISHPEMATEAMNRLAQAFMCLTDPEAKKTYDGRLGLRTAETVAVATLPRAKRKLEDTSVSEQTQLDWSKVQVPPPVRGCMKPVFGLKTCCQLWARRMYRARLAWSPTMHGGPPIATGFVLRLYERVRMYGSVR